MDSVRTERRWMHRLAAVESRYLMPETPDVATKYFPYVYVEIRIDFNNVRTGYKNVVNLTQALPIYADCAVVGWVEDMILNVNTGRIQENLPAEAQLQPLPDFVSGEFIKNIKNRYAEYLNRTLSVEVYRNAALNIYSQPDESREDFIRRCREQLYYDLRGEMNQLHSVCKRKQEQLREKYLGIPREEEPEEMGMLRRSAQDKDVYVRYTEYIDALFLQDEDESGETPAPPPISVNASEMESRLAPLAMEVGREIAAIRECYADKASTLDKYAIYPAIRDIRYERSFILWIPEKSR